MKFILFFNSINSVPQTAATTFAFLLSLSFFYEADSHLADPGQGFVEFESENIFEVCVEEAVDDEVG